MPTPNFPEGPSLHHKGPFAATLPVTTGSKEQLFSSLEMVKNYLRYTTGDDCLSHLLLMFAEKELVRN